MKIVQELKQTSFVFILTLITILAAYEVGYIVNNVVTIWPATAVIYCAIRQYNLPGFIWTTLAGCLHILFWLDLPSASILLPIASSFCAWAAVLLERHYNSEINIFKSSRNMIIFLTAGIGFFSLSAAIAGNLIITTIFSVSWDEFGVGVWNWFLADYTGGIMLAPLLIAMPVFYKEVLKEWRPAFIEICLSLFLLVFISLVFVSGIMKNYGTFSPIFLALPGAIYLSTKKASARLSLCFFIFMVGALMMVVGSDGNHEDNVGLRTVQLYLTIVLLTGLILHSYHVERAGLIKKLATERNQLEHRVTKRTSELAQEVFEKNELANEMKSLARRDPLTGLYNRRYFAELAMRDLKRCRRNHSSIFLCMLDIDFFKNINDTFGHPTGDSVLVEVADIMLKETRSDIDSVVRLGGEEFAILIPQTSLKHVSDISERIRKRIGNYKFPVQSNIDLKEAKVNVTISIGIAECVNSHETIEEALKSADRALYKAKQNGRNCIVVDKLSNIA